MNWQLLQVFLKKLIIKMVNFKLQPCTTFTVTLPFFYSAHFTKCAHQRAVQFQGTHGGLKIILKDRANLQIIMPSSVYHTWDNSQIFPNHLLLILQSSKTFIYPIFHSWLVWGRESLEEASKEYRTHFRRTNRWHHIASSKICPSMPWSQMGELSHYGFSHLPFKSPPLCFPSECNAI